MSALGKLGSVNITTANTPVLLATLDESGIVNVLVCNRNVTDQTVRIAISPNAVTTTPNPEDWIEYDVAVAANQPMERTGLSLSSGEKIFVQANATGVSFRANGVPST